MTHPGYEMRSSNAASSTTLRIDDDPFRYGYRWIETPAGMEMVPLTYEDLLDPQEGDRVSEDSLNRFLGELFTTLLRQRFADEEDVAVWGNFKLRFGDEGKGPAPDACVARGVRAPDRRRGSFWVGREPGRIVLVIEIVSRAYKNKDYKDAKAIYEREKIPELILVEPLGEYMDGPYKLTLYRLDDAGIYQEIPHDADGGVISEQTDIRIASDPEGWGLAWTDHRTGERLRTPEEQAKLAEKQAKLAEEQAKLAEEQAARADRETAARQAAEERIRVLEEELRLTGKEERCSP